MEKSMQDFINYYLEHKASDFDSESFSDCNSDSESDDDEGIKCFNEKYANNQGDLYAKDIQDKIINKELFSKPPLGWEPELLLKNIEMGSVNSIGIYMLADTRELLSDKIDKLFKSIFIGYRNTKNKDLIYKLNCELNKYFVNEISMIKITNIIISKNKLISQLESNIKSLKHHNKILQNQLDYSPDGPGYEESKEHFESVLEQ